LAVFNFWGLGLENYTKRALLFEEQLQLLRARGLVIDDQETALNALQSISYFRLSAYWYPFREVNLSGEKMSQFVAGTSFYEVLALYEFDRRLRLVVMDAIERVEVAIRTQVTYCLAHEHGPFAHVDPSIFHRGFDHVDLIAKLEKETRNSSDQFIAHYKNKYLGFPTIPIWMLTEVMSLGALSRLYRGLRRNADKQAISTRFDIHQRRLGDWLHVLTYVRNVCAHHGRLWNRQLAIRAEKTKDLDWLPPKTPRRDRIFYVLLILRGLMRTTKNGGDWVNEVENLVRPFVADRRHRLSMGFPENWTTHPLWR
jgi:abortive infection bacteriophage resistance protein